MSLGAAAAAATSGGSEGGDVTEEDGGNALPSWAQGIGALAAVIATIYVLVCMYGASQRARRLKAKAMVVCHACATLVWVWATFVHHHMATSDDGSDDTACSRVSPWLVWVAGEAGSTALLCVKIEAVGRRRRRGGAPSSSGTPWTLWVAVGTVVGTAVVVAAALSIDAIVDRSLVENDDDCSETAVASVAIGGLLLLHVVVVWLVMLTLGGAHGAGVRMAAVLATCTAFAGTFLWWAITYGDEKTSMGHHAMTVVCVCVAASGLFGTRLENDAVLGKVGATASRRGCRGFRRTGRTAGGNAPRRRRSHILWQRRRW